MQLQQYLGVNMDGKLDSIKVRKNASVSVPLKEAQGHSTSARLF